MQNLQISVFSAVALDKLKLLSINSKNHSKRCLFNKKKYYNDEIVMKPKITNHIEFKHRIATKKRCNITFLFKTERAFLTHYVKLVF